MAQTTWNVNLRRAEVLNMSWSGAAVIAGELLDKHGYQYTFCIAAGLCAVALVVFSPLLLLKLQRLPSGPVEVSPNAKAHNAPKFERFESGAARGGGCGGSTLHWRIFGSRAIEPRLCRYRAVDQGMQYPVSRCSDRTEHH